MGAPSVTYTFTNATVADATQVNQNFTDLVNALTDGNGDYTASSMTLSGALNVGGVATFDGSIKIKEGISAPTNITGYTQLYVDASDSALKVKDSAGNVYYVQLTAV